MPVPPLSPARQALVTDHERFIRYCVDRYGRDLGPRFGRADLYQEARLTATRVAATYDQTRGKFTTAVGVAIMRRFRWLRHQTIVRGPVWRTMPAAGGGGDPVWQKCADLADHRPPADFDPWADEEFALRRRWLPMRLRVVLYLVVVEGLSRTEIAATFAVSSANVGAWLRQARRGLSRRS